VDDGAVGCEALLEALEVVGQVSQRLVLGVGSLDPQGFPVIDLGHDLRALVTDRVGRMAKVAALLGVGQLGAGGLGELRHPDERR